VRKAAIVGSVLSGLFLVGQVSVASSQTTAAQIAAIVGAPTSRPLGVGGLPRTKGLEHRVGNNEFVVGGVHYVDIKGDINRITGISGPGGGTGRPVITAGAGVSVRSNRIHSATTQESRGRITQLSPSVISVDDRGRYPSIGRLIDDGLSDPDYRSAYRKAARVYPWASQQQQREQLALDLMREQLDRRSGNSYSFRMTQ
jgi:hypothetical protein